MKVVLENMLKMEFKFPNWIKGVIYIHMRRAEVEGPLVELTFAAGRRQEAPRMSSGDEASDLQTRFWAAPHFKLSAAAELLQGEPASSDVTAATTLAILSPSIHWVCILYLSGLGFLSFM